MFNYPKDFVLLQKRSSALVKAEQTCYKCSKWFEIPVKDVQFILDYEKNNPGKFGIPMTNATCSHCGTSNIIESPGKYDSIRSKNPKQQRYSFQ